MGATKGAAYTPNETFPPKFQELKFLTPTENCIASWFTCTKPLTSFSSIFRFDYAWHATTPAIFLIDHPERTTSACPMPWQSISLGPARALDATTQIGNSGWNRCSKAGNTVQYAACERAQSNQNVVPPALEFRSGTCCVLRSFINAEAPTVSI